MSTTKAEYANRRKQWAKALRSGKYKQTTGALRKTAGYCCLGVACEVYKQNTRHGKWTKDNEFLVGGIGDDVILPQKVASYFGLETNPDIITKEVDDNDPGPTDLTSANDEYEYTFKDIADLIESGKVEVVR